MDTTKWRQQKSTYNVENSIEEGNESKLYFYSSKSWFLPESP